MKLEPELRAEFMAAAVHRPASQILRELMREFVQHQRETREYDEFLRRKVEIGRATMHVGLGRSHDEVAKDHMIFFVRRWRRFSQLVSCLISENLCNLRIDRSDRVIFPYSI